MLGLGAKKDQVMSMMSNGAIIIDVRTKGEYVSGHIEGSKNIPLDELEDRIEEIINMNKPVIACCASGMRSGSATAMLKNAGVESLNGGGWKNLSYHLD